MRKIDELRTLLGEISNKESLAYVKGAAALMKEYEADGNREEVFKWADEVIGHSLGNPEFDENSDFFLRSALSAYDAKARMGDFRSYCIALEWNRPVDKKYYVPRMKVLEHHGIMQAFQDFEDDKLDLLVLNMPPRTGKLLADKTPVLTKNGWKYHGDLKVGDYVLNEKGDFVKVLAINEKQKTTHKITFSNGETLECHKQHEWVVYDRHTRTYKTVETEYMIGKLKDGHRYRFQLPLKEPVKGEYIDLPVKPYTFGAWLGDGTNTNPYITGDKGDAKIIGKVVADGYGMRNVWVHKDTGCYTYDFEGLRFDLQKIGMCHSRKTVPKYIPPMYLTASIEQRLELLAGLLDTDGTLRRKEHRYTFTTCEKSLCESFVSLVNTFGWRTCVVEYPPKTSTSGIKGKQVVYTISFNPTMEIPCQLERKQLNVFSKQRRISVVSIDEAEGSSGNCIQVEGGVYLAGKQLTPTHNSTISLFFLTFRAALYPEQSIIGSGHSTMLTQSFYNELLEIITSDEYRFNQIFTGITLVNKNSEYSFIDFNRKKRFHTLTFRSVDAGTTGSVEASNLLYCDDLVKDAEQANNKDRLDKLYEMYTSTLKDRKVQRLCKDGVYRTAPELHVNTPWSLYDVTNRVINAAREKGTMDRVRIVSIPCWNERHESNFIYDYGKGFDIEYYEDMQRAEDPVIFSAKYLMECIERDGRPFERNNLTYYTELPGGEPDTIVAYNDVAHGGADYMSMPIGYVYGNEVYIVDVLFIHEFGGDNVSRPKVCEKIISHGVSRCGIEAANGGDFYASMIDHDLKDRGYRCNITRHNVNTRQRKLDRILACQTEICGTGVNGAMKIYFKDPNILSRDSEYMAFLRQLWNWSQKEGSIQKTQHDRQLSPSIAMC